MPFKIIGLKLHKKPPNMKVTTQTITCICFSTHFPFLFPNFTSPLYCCRKFPNFSMPSISKTQLTKLLLTLQKITLHSSEKRKRKQVCMITFFSCQYQLSIFYRIVQGWDKLAPKQRKHEFPISNPLINS